METNYNYDIKTYYTNVSLNAEGAERELYSRITKRDIFGALDLMDDNKREVEEAIREYNPQLHKVMKRPNKHRDNDEPYITEKLPRTRQRYINEIELFFLLGKPIVWKKKDGDDECYKLFTRFLNKHRFNAKIRMVKRLAGSETESALIFHLTRGRDDELNVKSFVAARSRGHRLRPMFDQFGDMIAFSYTYRLRQDGRNVLHADIFTKDFFFYCEKTKEGWSIETFQNPIGKIPVLYFHQQKAWDGVMPRLDREEMLDSKLGDTNNYFADPMAAATADVIQSMAEPDKPGRLVQLVGANSKFEYINPPQNSTTRQDESISLQKSALFDTFTPDFSYENLKGMGTLSGAALKNALTLGYIKRDTLKDHYEEMIDRTRSVIIEILKLENPTLAKKFDELVLEFEFSEPFEEDKEKRWNAIATLRGNNLVSLETAVRMLALTENPDEEIDRIRMELMELEFEKNLAQNGDTPPPSEEQQTEEGGAQ